MLGVAIKLIIAILKPIVESYFKESGLAAEILKKGGESLLGSIEEKVIELLKSKVFLEPTMEEKLEKKLHEVFLSLDENYYSKKLSGAWEYLNQNEKSFETEEEMLPVLESWLRTEAGKASGATYDEIKSFAHTFFQHSITELKRDKELEQYFLTTTIDKNTKEILQKLDNVATKDDTDKIRQKLDNVATKDDTNQILERLNPPPSPDPVITTTVPTHPSQFFQGRDTDLQEIKKRAKEKIVLLNGIGGIGKTEICRRIFWDYRDNLTDGVEHLGWIFYESSLSSSLFGKFPMIEETDPERYQEAVRQMIGSLGKKLLLFVDNANELKSEEAIWLNKLPCRMILTSRTEIKRFVRYPIDTLSPEQCRIIYQENSEDMDPESIPYIDEIIQLAAYHTQTVELLAKTQTASCLTVKELRDALLEQGFTLAGIMETVDVTYADAEYNQRLIEHLAKVFDIAKIKDPEAIRILKLFSLLATNTPIEVNRLKDWLQISNLNAVNNLVRHGWFKQNKQDGNYYFSIHPVIAETVQYKCRPEYALAEPLIKKLTIALNASSGKGVAVQNALLPHCIAVEKAFHDLKTIDFAWFRDRIAAIIQETGDYARALTYFQCAVDTAEKMLGMEHPDTAATYYNIAGVYYRMGDYDKALEYYNKALVIVEKVLGAEHPNTAATYNNIADVYQNMGNYDKALEYYNKALVIFEKVLGTEHQHTAVIYDNIGLVYREKNDYDKASEYTLKALAIHEKVLGTEHPDTAATYNILAGVYKDMGDYDMALEYYNKALVILEKALGTEHPDTAATYHNIAGVYYRMGDYDMALEYYNKALIIKEQILGPEHPDTAATYNNIAGVYKDKGDYDKALEYDNKALVTAETMLGTEHPDTAATYHNIAGFYNDMGDYDMALAYYKKALVIFEKVLGTKHSSIATTFHNIAVVYKDKGDYDKALDYYNKALAIREQVLGAEHPDTATTYNNIAGVYKDMGYNDKALEFALKAEHILETVFGVIHPNTRNVCLLLAVLYHQTGDMEKAQEYKMKAGIPLE